MASLTRIEAVERADLLQVQAYRIELDLAQAAEADGFGSTTTITFRCRRPGADSFVELKPAQLYAVSLNGTPVDPAGLTENRLWLRGLAAANELVVSAAMSYSNTGEGLHRFRDPEDGRVYLYAQSFLDEAQRVFACFDQPDLKAAATLAVTAPAGWEVAGNSAGTQVAPGRWEFATTVRLATYVISVIAGPYHVRRDEHDGIPLAAYCRRSLAAHLDKDISEIFELTKAFFDQYHQLFGTRYPFDKYDQAFVPEFNEGAMENAALIVLRDEYIFRSAVADDEREQRARVIAHELAHMWFGDLVTMTWWDDLWLNESFAEYLAYRVTADASRFTSAWTGFTVGRKGWGYAADQRPSTHPVAPESLPDSGLALLNFDGISYAKGASVLRQLASWLGDDAFLGGLRDYIRRYAFGNANLADLLAALARAAGRDLRDWAEVWLRRAQVNTLRPVLNAADGRYTSVEILQSAPAGYPTLRPHRIDVGVYSGGTRRRRVTVDVDPATDHGRTRVVELEGTEVGEVLLLNDGDLSYAKIRFDEVSRAALPAALPQLTDPLARALIWAAVADSARDAEMPMGDFVALFAAGLPAETEMTVLNDLLRFATVRPADARFPVTGAVSRFTPPDRLSDVEAAVAAACQEALEQAPAGSGRQLLLAGGWATAAGVADVPRLRDWLHAKGPTGLPIEAKLRWTVLSRLCALGEAGTDEIDLEVTRDRTASGGEHAARCRALLPEPAAKTAAWRVLIEDDTGSNRLVAAAGEGFWHPHQVDLTRPYVARYFDELPAVARRRTLGMTLQVARIAFPRHVVEPETAAQADQLIDHPEVSSALRRAVVDYTDELRRALAGRTLERS